MSKKCWECKQNRKSNDAEDFERCSACSSRIVYYLRSKYRGWYSRWEKKVKDQENLVNGYETNK